MKKIFSLALCGLMLVSFASMKPVMAQKKAVKKEMARGKVGALEGGKVRVEQNDLTGYDMMQGLSEDGLKIVKVAYKWFAGTASANDKSTAIEMALAEARAEVSRSILIMVQTHAEQGRLVNNGKVQQALKSYWEQKSFSIQVGCEPIGDALIEYNKKTGMYQARAKVGMRGDRYLQMLQNPTQNPATLSGEELQNFEAINTSIIATAKAEVRAAEQE